MASTCRFDLEDALQRVMFWMLSPVGERAGRELQLFDFDETRPYDLKISNPLQAIFRQCLVNAVRTSSDGSGFRPFAESSIQIGYPSTTDDQATTRPTARCQPTRFLVVFQATISRMLNDLIGFVAAAVHAGDATGRPVHVDPAR